MYLPLVILFTAILLSGLSFYFLPPLPEKLYQLLLAFGGSYLFSFILLHMFPDLFGTAIYSAPAIARYLLLGFFAQIFLEFVSHSTTHRMMHKDDTTREVPLRKATSLLIALCFHAVLEGMLLGILPTAQPGASYGLSLLFGILLHEIPIALTLALMLDRALSRKLLVVLLLLLFALASPVGWLLAHHLQVFHVFSSHTLLALQAMATGNLLHMATTILFETNPHHHFTFRHLASVVAGGIMALVI